MKQNRATSTIIGIVLVCLTLGAMFGGLSAGVSNVAASSDEIAYYFDPNSGDASVGYNGNSPWGISLDELPACEGYHLPVSEGYIAYEDGYDAFADETEYGFGYYINSLWPDEAHWNWDGSYIGDGSGLPPGVEWHAGTGDRNPSPMKVLVYAPWTGKSCVAVIGDSGPAPWTGRQFGVSNKVFDALDLPASYTRADDTTFCRGNPNPGHAPSSDTNPEDYPVIKYEDNPYWVEFSWADPSLPSGPVTTETIYVDDDLADYPDADFTRIQEAVDAASSGDTITVYPGTYTENIDVNKEHLTIRSEGGADSTIVQAASPDDHVFEVTADYMNIQGFTVKGATGSDKAGIYLDNVDHCQISNNIILNNKHGIHLNDSSYNDIDDNTVKLCSGSGIFLDYSPISGPYLPAVGHNIDEGDRPDYANPWEDEPLAYDDNTGTFAKSEVSHNTWTAWLELLPPTEKSLGIRFWIDAGSQRSFFRVEVLYSGYKSWDYLKDWNFPYSPAPKGEWVVIDFPEKLVEKVRVKFHSAGISGFSRVYLSEFQFKTVLDISCSNNDIIGNTVSDSGAGIRLSCASNNRIYLNNFVNNTDNGYSSDSTNLLNSAEEITYTYNGNAYKNYLGNHWSDYGAYFPPIGYNDPGDQWEDESLAYDENRDTYARVYVTSIDTSWLELLAPLGESTQGIRFWGSGGPLRVDIYYDGGWHCLKDWPWGISSAPGNQWVELTYPSRIVEKARIKFHGRVLRGWSHLSELQFKTTPSDYAGSDANGDGIGDIPYSIDGDSDNYPLMEPFENYILLPSEQPQLKAPWEGTARISQGNHGSTSHFDHGTWDNTYAIDVALPVGSDVLAPADGVVNWYDDDPGGGWWEGTSNRAHRSNG